MTAILRLSVQPALEPVTLAEAKAYVRQDQSDDDVVLALLISAARQYVETETGRALISQTWQAIWPEWPLSYPSDDEDFESRVIPSAVRTDSLTVAKLPFISLSGVTVNAAAWTSFTSQRTARGFRITPTTAAPTGEIIATFIAGYGTTATDVPADLRLAILKLVATCYDQVGASSFDMSGVSAKAESLPGFADTLHRYRLIT